MITTMPPCISNPFSNAAEIMLIRQNRESSNWRQFSISRVRGGTPIAQSLANRVQVDPFQDQGQLRCVQFNARGECLGINLGDLKAAAGKSLVPNAKSCSVPIQN